MLDHFHVLRVLNQPWVIKLGRAVRARDQVDILLRAFPYGYKLSSGIKVPVNSLEGWLLARELFSVEVYSCLRPYVGTITHFLDVGSNRGFFPVYLAHLRRKQGLATGDLQGLAIDANPKLVALSQSILSTLSLGRVDVINGMVGCAEGATGSFYLHASDGLSSRFIEGTEIQVPGVSIEAEWTKRFPQHLPDVIKIDIEGSERDLLEAEGEFISRGRLVIIECHSPMAPLEAVTERMKAHGFVRKEVISGAETVHCALFVRGEA